MHEAILARHGESAFSVTETISGDPKASVPLTEAGREQARRLGELLADEPIDLAVTSEFERTRETAEIALEGRDVPRLILPELNDPRAGEFEGRPLADYREWAWTNGPLADPPGGGESRAKVVERVARGYRKVLERPERTILVVGHSLPMAYALKAAAGMNPTARVELLGYAEPHRLTADELERAAEVLELWAAEPRFA
jgi:broad specificity phosphatase PhoE